VVPDSVNNVKTKTSKKINPNMSGPPLDTGMSNMYKARTDITTINVNFVITCSFSIGVPVLIEKIKVHTYFLEVRRASTS